MGCFVADSICVQRLAVACQSRCKSLAEIVAKRREVTNEFFKKVQKSIYFFVPSW